MRRDFLEAYVEKLLRDVTGSTRISADADGDYPVRYGSALYFVRLVGDAQANVQVFATTHSWECILNAHEALKEESVYDLRLFRLDRTDDQLKVATYNAKTLDTSLDMSLEVR